MADLQIRAGEKADAPAIAEIINHEIRTGLAVWRTTERTTAEIEALISERLAADQGVYIAERNGTVVGWASYGAFRAGEGYAQTTEHSVHVIPAEHRTGVGHSLLSHLLSHADHAGVHAMIGGVESSNHASIALHAKLGFVEVGRLPQVGRKFDRWLTLVLMQRIANSG